MDECRNGGMQESMSASVHSCIGGFGVQAGVLPARLRWDRRERDLSANQDGYGALPWRLSWRARTTSSTFRRSISSSKTRNLAC